MSTTAARICEGEVMQFQMTTLETWSLAHYRTVIEGKTAVLLATATEAPAMLAGVKDEEREALRSFGMAYGRAFQMQDDRLDLLGDPAILGKPVGGDLREGKATHATLVLIEAGVEEAADIVRRHARRDGDIERMRTLVLEHGADEATRSAIRDEIHGAVRALDVFPASTAREALTHLAERELARLD